MIERCALKSGEYWDNNGERPIPAVCQRQCRSIWEEIMWKPGDVTEIGEDPLDCTVDADSFSISLRRTREDRFGSERTIQSISECVVHEAQRSSESWTFECPHN